MKTKMSMLKGIVIGVLITVLLTSTVAMANSVTRELLFGVNITIDGDTLVLAEDSQPFTMDARTFLPLRAMADALDLGIDWDPATRTAIVTTPAEAVTLPAPIEMVPITAAEITALQRAWGEGLVAISTAYAEGEDYAAVAQDVLDTLYGYVDGIVLFKPTVAQEVPFRFTEAAAASYFIGGSIDEDTGFALLPWTEVRFGTDGRHIINGETALWMGSVYLTNDEGEVIRVEKSLGLYRDSEGDVRIQLHHSSVPFSD